MKKTLLLVLGACMFIATAQAQFKQSGGEKNLQVLFAPLGGQPVSINGISFRKFNSTGTAAWRLNIFIGMTNETEVLEQAGDTTQHPTSVDVSVPGSPFTNHLNTGLNPQADRRSKTFTFSLRPGYEKHFAGTDRISPYLGAELLFSKTSATEERDEVEMSNYSYFYDAEDVGSPGFPFYVPNNVPDTLNVPWTLYTLTKKGDGASTTFGINLIAGVDFYIVKNLSLGAELGFGFSTTSFSDIEDEKIVNTVSPDPDDFSSTTGTFTTTSVSVTNAIAPTNDSKQGKSSQLGPNVVGQFKLGWLF